VRRLEGAGASSTPGAQQEASRPAQGDDGNEGLPVGASHAVTVPSDRVAAVLPAGEEAGLEYAQGGHGSSL